MPPHSGSEGTDVSFPVRRYLENVPSIVPLLEKEYRIAAKRLEDTQEELNDLHPDKCAPSGLVGLCPFWQLARKTCPHSKGVALANQVLLLPTDRLVSHQMVMDRALFRLVLFAAQAHSRERAQASACMLGNRLYKYGSPKVWRVPPAG